MTIFTPSRVWIEDLRVGDMALDCFGKIQEVKKIAFRGTDLKGKMFVGYNTKFGENSTISHSAKEGEVISTLPITKEYKSVQNIPDKLIVESDSMEGVSK